MIKISEHFAIEGKCEFYHLPYDWKGGMCFCNRCKKVKNKLKVEFHQGAISDYVQVICSTCKKTIWIAELTSNEEDYHKFFGHKILIKDDKKCHVCKKPTNQFDCYSYKGKKGYYYCSERCDKHD